MSDYNDPEHHEYDDDEYNFYPHYEYGGHEFKFDMTAWEKWLKDVINDIIEENNTWTFKVDNNDLPVNDSTDSTGVKEYFLYFGQNQYAEPIWKLKYFIKEDLDIAYKNHFAANAEHIIKQPQYYRSMFDLMN